MAKNGDFSPGTKALIGRMMKEKKISFRQQKQITRAMSVGQALPVEGRFPKFISQERYIRMMI